MSPLPHRHSPLSRPLPATGTILPNVAFWNATNPSNNLTYQIQVSVLDGNALGITASEAFKCRKSVSSTQPDAVVISVGYPLTDSVYDLAQRATDFPPPLPTPQTPPSGANPFLSFLTTTLKPFIKPTVFPSITFTRDALYGHSFAGLFVLYSLLQNPSNFDSNIPGTLYSSNASSEITTKPAVMITYGELEQFPQRTRTETEAEFQLRKNFLQPFKLK
ncbi:Alpha/Beta hydrolase protein [Apiosordaria backusii]|uniref:Alpha/Beta hydrolase protein n=1 Tax=Apiosordaria backusii TaxID=314023 RepID=A0AA40BL70_9PEZI|nr:Alpha/Beta hydrolase protein [Apiosordaria backusii]